MLITKIVYFKKILTIVTVLISVPNLTYIHSHIFCLFVLAQTRHSDLRNFNPINISAVRVGSWCFICTFLMNENKEEMSKRAARMRLLINNEQKLEHGLQYRDSEHKEETLTRPARKRLSRNNNTKHENGLQGIDSGEPCKRDTTRDFM